MDVLVMTETVVIRLTDPVARLAGIVVWTMVVEIGAMRVVKDPMFTEQATSEGAQVLTVNTAEV